MVIKRIKPWAEMAEIRLRLKRSPVAFTTGVWPTGAQLVPVKVRAHCGLVTEVDQRSFEFGLPLDRRVLFVTSP